jgi:hypothetical protein
MVPLSRWALGDAWPEAPRLRRSDCYLAAGLVSTPEDSQHSSCECCAGCACEQVVGHPGGDDSDHGVPANLANLRHLSPTNAGEAPETPQARFRAQDRPSPSALLRAVGSQGFSGSHSGSHSVGQDRSVRAVEALLRGISGTMSRECARGRANLQLQMTRHVHPLELTDILRLGWGTCFDLGGVLGKP